MSIKYQLKDGEAVRKVAEGFGFPTTDAIAEHPDNAAIVAKRGGIDFLQPGDMFTIPEGTKGKKGLGPGRGHTLVVSKNPGTFTIIVDTAFRIPKADEPGDLSASPVRWNAFKKGQALAVSGATVKVKQSGGGLVFENTTNAAGQAVFPHLDDGEWQIDIDPASDQLSKGEARGDATGDHGLGFYERRGKASGKPKKPYPRNGTYEAEYRPMRLAVKVEAKTITSASVLLPVTAGPRPNPVVPFWKKVGEGTGRQAMHIEWKADTLRRIKTKLRPMQRARVAGYPLELIVVHQTATTGIDGALKSFLGPGSNSGAHFVNDIDGHVVRMADERYFTQHAGGYGTTREPNWNLHNKDRDGNRRHGYLVNDRGIGIETVHTDDTDPDHVEAKHNPFTDAQYASLIDLIESLKRAHGISARNVVGHGDLTPKARCPGPHLEWEKLEGADCALAPADLPAGEVDRMFGGFFAGTAGATRTLKVDDREAKAPDGTMRVIRGGKTIADSLASGPIRALEAALATIGYGVDEKVKSKEEGAHDDGTIDKVLAFCTAQFVRRYCTGKRVRLDQKAAYLEVNLKKSRNRVFVDLELAKLIRRVELAATAAE